MAAAKALLNRLQNLGPGLAGLAGLGAIGYGVSESLYNGKRLSHHLSPPTFFLRVYAVRVGDARAHPGGFRCLSARFALQQGAQTRSPATHAASSFVGFLFMSSSF